MWIVKNSFITFGHVIIGLGAGIIVAGGLFALIIGLGVISDFADRTHTAKHVQLYENSVALGGILGNIWWMSQYSIFNAFDVSVLGILNIIGEFAALFFGLFLGIFTGCWAMALAETLHVFPIFVRRFRIVQYVPHMILAIAVGKGLGALIFLVKRW